MMNQVNSKLRRATGRYMHWCEGCESMHQLPDSWTFNGNLDKPSFHPSFKHSGWLGTNTKTADGKPGICHYILTDGILDYCGDSTHHLAGTKVPLPDLPTHMEDH